LVLCKTCHLKKFLPCLIFTKLNKRKSKKECPCQKCLVNVCCEKVCNIRFAYCKSLESKFLVLQNKKRRKKYRNRRR